ncbi:hypothetical protein SY88_22145 [Clostridiales bacterium PH28_bin88]|nr:hypothetical protein SY88_22145 [Clostridiales bacterium PH28_bin88]
MAGFPIGMIVLLVVSVLIYFGLAQRVLDRMGISDKVALGFLAAIIVGSFINIPLSRARVDASVNVGGGLVPVALAIYVLTRAGTSKEVIRALGAAVAAAAAIYVINTRLFSGDPWQTGTDFLDPLYVYPLVAGGIAYIIGRSRRAAFVAATLGVLFLDVFDWVTLQARGIPGNISIGGAGALDAIVLSGVVAVLLAELIGETRERLQGGPEAEGHPKAMMDSLRGIQDHRPLGQPARKELPENRGANGQQDDGGEHDA